MSKPYKFQFYRDITNGVGRSFHSTVEIIEIRRAKSPERAQQAAILRFIRHQKLRNWNCLAAGYGVSHSQDGATGLLQDWASDPGLPATSSSVGVCVHQQMP